MLGGGGMECVSCGLRSLVSHSCLYGFNYFDFQAHWLYIQLLSLCYWILLYFSTIFLSSMISICELFLNFLSTFLIFCCLWEYSTPLISFHEDSLILFLWRCLWITYITVVFGVISKLLSWYITMDMSLHHPINLHVLWNLR